MTSITRPQFSATNRPTGYYTYAYLRENGTPWYIGKGTARRAWDRHGNPKTKKTWRPPSNDRILILKWDLTEAAAHRHEMYLIGIYGNAFTDGGLLTRNFTDGGEGLSGYQYTEELRQVRAQQLAGNTFGALVEWTPELRQKHSEATKGIAKTRTAKLVARHQEQGRVHTWNHADHGTRLNSASEMGRVWGGRESFGKLSRGVAASHKGWVCADPLTAFAPADTDHVARINKAAETRTAKNAAQLGISVEEYRAMTYNQRYRLRKECGLAKQAA